MIRVSLSYLFELANKLDPLGGLPDADTPYNDIWINLAVAEGAIKSLYSQTLYGPYLRSSTALGQQLLQMIKSQTDNTDYTRVVTRFTLYQIRDLYKQFRIAFLAEIGVMHSYFVTQKGGFDTVSLLAFGENLFPDDLLTKAPEAIFDAREAGKCLAYELPTACGFHVFRATETVLRKYYDYVARGAAPPKIRTLGVYVRAMRQAKVGDEKILSALDQMTQLHRNPLIHPEAVLTLDEAIAAFGIARSVITGMLAVLPVIPPTTTSAIPSAGAASIGPTPALPTP
jgi:hypothetical protein